MGLLRNLTGKSESEALTLDQSLYTLKLTEEERLKQERFRSLYFNESMRDSYLDGILERLTPDDIRQLMVAEDELNRGRASKRIFPTAQSFKYFRFLEPISYYYKLMDAWEHRFGKRRSEGRELLRNLQKKLLLKG